MAYCFSVLVVALLRVLLQSGREVRVTPEHLLLTCTAALVPANTLVPHSCLSTVEGEDRVMRVEHTQGSVVTVVTEARGLVVVNGVLASPFAVSHELVELYYDVYRALGR
jgi:hypothetical protein